MPTPPSRRSVTCCARCSGPTQTQRNSDPVALAPQGDALMVSALPEVTMRRIVYDVAASLDGFVSHSDGSVEGFLADGEHVTDYLQRLAGYDTVLMGRSTYEWGY